MTKLKTVSEQLFIISKASQTLRCTCTFYSLYIDNHLLITISNRKIQFTDKFYQGNDKQWQNVRYPKLSRNTDPGFLFSTAEFGFLTRISLFLATHHQCHRFFCLVIGNNAL